MDNAYIGGSEPTVLKAIPPSCTSPYLESFLSLLREPLPSLGTSSSPISGLYEATSRMRYNCEGMAEGIFSRAATNLYEKTARNYSDMSCSSPSTCDLRIHHTSPPPSPILSMRTASATDMTASSCNTLNYHDSSLHMLPIPKHAPVAPTTQEQGAVWPYEHEGNHHGLVSPVSFSEFMLHAMVISEASTRKLTQPGSSLMFPTRLTPDQNSSSLTEGISPFIYSKLSTDQADVAGATASTPDSSNSQSKQDSSVMSADDLDADCKIQRSNITKRRNYCGLRKAQPRKVICIPFGEGKPRAEAPPSDTWAWRKYGQKPIKGSPFPRSYYRCSSSKGCSARKQVERSRSDPAMVIVTYTADHNHPWPTSLNKSSNSSKAAGDPIINSSKDKSQGMEDFRKVGNLFSSIVNFPNAGADQQVVSSTDSLQEGDSFFMQRDVDLCLSRTSTESDDVFDNLGELPELSTIFSHRYGEGPQLDDEGIHV